MYFEKKKIILFTDIDQIIEVFDVFIVPLLYSLGNYFTHFYQSTSLFGNLLNILIEKCFRRVIHVFIHVLSS